MQQLVVVSVLNRCIQSTYSQQLLLSCWLPSSSWLYDSQRNCYR